MERIIKKLYNIDIEKIFLMLKNDKETTNKEWQNYDALYEESSENARKFLLRYINARAERERKELEIAYTCGFKTAIKLLTECFKE